MIKHTLTHTDGLIHSTEYVIDIPDYFSYDLLYEMVRELEVWVDEERRPHVQCVFFPTVYAVVRPYSWRWYAKENQAIFFLYHKVIKRRTYRKIPQIVEELETRIKNYSIFKKHLITDNFNNKLIEVLNER